jgi:two-component system, sensor histidine kinase PdtaS
LSEKLREKELLIKEIHHRVKNNMQTVISLLRAQTSALENVDAVSALQSSQHRIHAMSLIHQKLYQSENLKSIDLADYIRELSGYLRDCLNTVSDVTFIYELEEMHVGIEHAIPLGLILNEAICNSIKHAFTGRDRNEITIKLGRCNNRNNILTIKDNGIGIAENIGQAKMGSMGMTLIHGLATQIGGSVALVSNYGLAISVSFKNLLSTTNAA